MPNKNDLTARWFDINPKALNHPVQKKLNDDFMKNKFRNYLIAAGRRSFKTERFAKRLLINEILKKKNHRKIFFAGAPTRGQAKEIFWDDLKRLTPPDNIKKVTETSLKIEISGGGTLRVRNNRSYSPYEILN